jgi:hypothetical protein
MKKKKLFADAFLPLLVKLVKNEFGRKKCSPAIFLRLLFSYLA